MLSMMNDQVAPLGDALLEAHEWILTTWTSISHSVRWTMIILVTTMHPRMINQGHRNLNERDRRLCGSRVRIHFRCRSSSTDEVLLAKERKRKDREASCLEKFRIEFHESNNLEEKAVETIVEAVKSKSIEADLVTGALVLLEENSRSECIPQRSQDIQGRWRLVFSTATLIKQFQYVPVDEYLVYDGKTCVISLSSELGPFVFDIVGMVNSWIENAMDFSWKQMHVKLFEKTIWTTDMQSKGKHYHFFFMGSNLLCARSSAGGITVFVLDDQQ